MGALAWAVAPQVAGHIDGPGAMARALIGLMLAGNWVWLAIITAQALFNTVFGEELLHRPGVIPFGVLDALAYAYPAKRYPSALLSMTVHSVQSLMIIGLTFSLVVF